MNPHSVSTNGQPSNPSNGPSLIRRRKPQHDPFFSNKRTSAQLRKPLVNGRPTPTANGTLAPATHLTRATTPNSQRSSSPPKSVILDAERVSGFSDPRVTVGSISYKDYKLVTSKRDLLSGLRYHILKLPANESIDIRDEAAFSKPARLHRRDPRSATPGQVKEETEDPRDGLNQEERDELNKRKEVRQKEREANLAQVAPSQGPSRKLNNFKKKTQQVFRPDYTSEEKRRIQTNYEEKLPWHLEDFDNKHSFIGQNQLGSGHVHAAFIYEEPTDSSVGKFRMIPIEKVYHFQAKRDLNIQKMTIEEVEARMKKRGQDPEWLVRQRESRIADATKELQAKKAKGLFFGSQTETIAGRTGEDADLDFDEDFADDEEGDLFADKDEDEKLAEKRIKEDQLQANFLDFKDEKEFDNADLRDKKEAEARKKNFKTIRRALEKRERNYNHGSDSEQSYGTSSDSEEERERLEKEKLANLAKEEAEGKKSGLNSSGANTPSGRKEKYGSSDREGGNKKPSSSKSLKRPGSPNLSEASGTDASTTRKKKKHRHLSSSQPTPQPSRPHSPVNIPSSTYPSHGDGTISNGQLDPSSALSMKPKKRKSALGGASTSAGSDTETGAAFSDGGAMSDNSKAKRLKLTLKDPSRSPSTLTPQGGSRAASPKPQQNAERFPTTDEIIAAIAEEGTTIKDFISRLAHPPDRRKELISLVKSVVHYDKATKILSKKKNV